MEGILILTEVRVGTGGWSYFHIPGKDRLKVYSRLFDFVEVNSTFYTLPSKGMVSSWRRRVPPTFEFFLRAHRSLTHTYKLKPIDPAINLLEDLLDLCDILGAEILHLLTEARLNGFKDLLASLDLRGKRIAWEVRRKPGISLNPLVVGFMGDLGIIHCTDLSIEAPSTPSDIQYSKLFGKGEHNIYQFTDQDLKRIHERAEGKGVKKTYLSFHGVKMYKDAARYKIFRETGSFPRVTNAYGKASLEEVLREDATFPVTKEELIKDQGWKIIDLSPGKRVPASTLLEGLPSKVFSNIREVIEALEP